MFLFKSYNKNYNQTSRKNFVYIDDVINVLIFLQKNKYSGIYNLGSGKATTFIKLIEFVFKSLNIKPKIKFIEVT